MPLATSSHKSASGRAQRLEDSAIHRLRQAVSACARPAMLFSAGKDSCVMLHLALKAFAPSGPAFPLLSVDTAWKFPEMHVFRDRAADAAGMRLIVQVNREGLAQGIGPFTHGAREHIRTMKSEPLRKALEEHGFDAVIDGARGDEERFRARGRLSPSGTRTGGHSEKTGGEHPMRFFPLAEWTELDVWRYIERERIEVPTLYFASRRPVVERDGMLIVRSDERMELEAGEEIRMRSVRFRTLGCWPLTGAVESQARTLPAVIREIRQSGVSERQDRMTGQSDGRDSEDRGGYF